MLTVASTGMRNGFTDTSLLMLMFPESTPPSTVSSCTLNVWARRQRAHKRIGDQQKIRLAGCGCSSVSVPVPVFFTREGQRRRCAALRDRPGKTPASPVRS